ncbi:MAG: rhamnulokinase [Fimbriimonadaceae bacterium]|nr:rhamnulokinase [Fimbriimonadaceae bacterium]
MAAVKTFMAFDLGAESGRGILGRFDGRRLDLEVVHRFANPTVKLLGTLHWDTPRQFSELVEALRICAREHTTDLAGIGVDTWGVDFGLFGRDGSLLGLPVHYRDARTDGMLDAAFAALGRERIFERTGIQFMQLNTLYQLLALQRQGAPALEVAERLLFMPDIMNYWFSGVQTSEVSIASTSQCWDPRARDWCRDLLDDLQIPSRIVPPVVEPGTVIGALTAELQADTGLGAVPVIAPACHDTGSAVAAVPAIGNRHAYLSSGTWSLMGLESPTPLISPQTLALNFTNEGGVCGTVRFLKNIMGLWLVQQTRAALARAGQDRDYATLTAEAAAAPAFGPLVDPDSPLFLNPPDMPAAIATFCQQTGQRPPESVGATVRCCLESLALKYRWVVERLEEVRGSRLEQLNIVGGGTQNKLLSQLTADATGRPVVAGPVEATATGNLLLQALAIGELGSLDEVRAVVRASFELETFTPNTATAGAWDGAWERFQKLLGA